MPPSHRPLPRAALTGAVVLFLVLVWTGGRFQAGKSHNSHASPSPAAAPAASAPQAPARQPWSTLLPPAHGVNPVPEGFVETACFEDVTRLAFPSTAPVPAGQRARVILGEFPDATGRHRFVRIEEVADFAAHRLLERRVMPGGHVVVQLQPGNSLWDLQRALPDGLKVCHQSLTESRFLVSLASRDADSLTEAVSTLQRLPMVSAAMVDGYVFAAGIPNDPLFDQQWGMHMPEDTTPGISEPGLRDTDIDAPEAWNYTTGSSNITVAVIDTGTDLNHEDLVANLWSNPGESGGGRETNGLDDDADGLADDVRGWDFVNDDHLPADDNGHGTHVAGIIGARGNNGIGVTGVCLQVGLVSLKALRANGSGIWSDVTDAITYAKNHGIRVANLSLGAYGAAPLGVQTVFENASGTLFCAAAGNGGLNAGGQRVGDNLDDVPFTPASLRLGNVMSIGAIRHNFRFSSFSNYGKVGVDMGAPGESILSTQMGGGYVRKSGTSMAAGFVSGAAAMCLVRRNHTPLEMRQMLQLSSKRFSSYSLYLTDPESPKQKCVTGGWLGLDLVAIQGTRNLRWQQLGMGEFSGAFTGKGFAHLLPDGTVKVWTPPVSTSVNIFGAAPETLSTNAVSIIDQTPYILYRNLILDQAGGEALYTVKTIPNFFTKKTIAVAGSRVIRPVVDSCVLLLAADGSVISLGGTDSWTARAAPPLANAGTPALVPGLADIVQIASDAAGKNHFFLRMDGTVFAAGQNEAGILGSGTTTAQPTPVAIAGLPPVQEFYFQDSNIFCRAMNGQIWAWGANAGALGNGSTAPVLTPLQIPAWGVANDFRSVAGQTTAVRADGSVLRSPGRLGALVPEVLATSGFFRPPALTPQSYGLNAIGQVFESGSNKIHRYITNPFHPGVSQVPLDTAAFEMLIDPVNGVGMALLNDGRVQTWGASGTGGLGKGRSSDYQVPVEVPELKGAAGISADQKELTLAWWADGRILSLGRVNPSDPGYTGAFSLPPLLQVADLKVSKYPGGIKLIARLSTNALWFFNLSAHFTDLSLGNVSPQTWQSMASPGFTDNIVTSGGFLLTHRALDGEFHGWDMTVQNPAPVHLPTVRPSGFGLMRELERGGAGLIFRGVNDQIWTCAVPALPIPAGTTLTGTSPGLGLRQLMADVPITSFQWPNFLSPAGTVHGLTSVFANPFNSYNLSPAGQTLAPLTALTASTNDNFEAQPNGFAVAKSVTALRADGTVWTFGAAPIGRGVPFSGSAIFNATPGAIPSLGDVTALWPGYRGTFVRRVDGSIWAWGTNIGGELGGSAYAAPADTLAYNISVQVQANGIELNNWLYTYFSNSELGSINISGDEADPDRDGLTNLEEYALGTDPKTPSDTPASPVGLTASFQTVSSEALSTDDATGAGASAGTCHFTVTLKRRARRPGIEYRVEFSDNLTTWTADPARLLKVLESEKTVVYRDVDPLGTVSRRSARLVIRKGN